MLIVMLLIMSCNSRDIYDRQLRDYEPSHIVDVTNRYCLMFQELVNDDIRNYDPIKLNDQVITSLREFGVNFKEETLPDTKEREREILKNKIIQRERDNNFKNCEYLIIYDLSTWKRERNEFTRNACFFLRITDIKTNSLIGRYQVCGKGYSRKNQNQYVAKSIKKWWEFQNSNKKRKFIMYNCTGGKCITRECDKDKCIVK